MNGKAKKGLQLMGKISVVVAAPMIILVLILSLIHI